MAFKRPLACCLVALALSGCAGINGPIVSKAPLGRVIIYRNGVAYFERYAAPGEKELTLRVPAARVDDFLKSLSIVDQKTGETMPASYPTSSSIDGSVLMTIKLPEHHNGLRISYVTESPAWKPSYRVVLGNGGKAKLQGWAVVDNVSGEDWKHVAVGVGSTSALSFRYDLHSVRLVERETLSTGSLLAAAPPTGGSPYAAGGQKMKVLANLDGDAIAGLVTKDAEKREAKAGGEAGVGKSTGTKHAGAGRAGNIALRPPADVSAKRPAPDPNVEGLVSQLRTSNERVRVEGFAQAGDKDPKGASLDRANKLRTVLIDNGVAADRVDAVGTGKLDEQQAARVVTVEGEAEPEQPKTGEAPAETQPLGHAHFVSNEPLTILADHSAMVSILSADTSAERVYYYDPISERGSKRFAFNAVRIQNPSGYTLDSGPFTVYENGQFLGEGLAE
ncbi:MAG TPA: hypothetical protein VFB62_20150, partial [Polyangiaceae bacterium]|nr:hypothetical protein [Polyangiaceae bacterium]